MKSIFYFGGYTALISVAFTNGDKELIAGSFFFGGLALTFAMAGMFTKNFWKEDKDYLNDYFHW